MKTTEEVIAGMLTPEGTLLLDEKPNLPAGRVTVVVRQALESQPESSVAKKRGPPAAQVLGIWNLSGYAPSDAELEKILAEELQKKHAP